MTIFATVDERNRNNSTRQPIGILTEVCERDDTEVPDVSTSVAATTPVVFDVEPVDNSSPKINLPNGFLPQPIATTTCRPRTWMQQIAEGQINEPTREDDSDKSNPSEVNVLTKEIPDVLGHEWRVLHPFELPGVRFPTDSTPPNQRRLAENDALVELIQTTKYFDDTPTWGQRDYRIYPLNMVTPSIEEEAEDEVEVEEDENRLMNDQWKGQMEDWKEDSPMEMKEE